MFPDLIRYTDIDRYLRLPGQLPYLQKLVAELEAAQAREQAKADVAEQFAKAGHTRKSISKKKGTK